MSGTTDTGRRQGVALVRDGVCGGHARLSPLHQVGTADLVSSIRGMSGAFLFLAVLTSGHSCWEQPVRAGFSVGYTLCDAVVQATWRRSGSLANRPSFSATATRLRSARPMWEPRFKRSGSITTESRRCSQMVRRCSHGVLHFVMDRGS